MFITKEYFSYIYILIFSRFKFLYNYIVNFTTPLEPQRFNTKFGNCSYFLSIEDAKWKSNLGHRKTNQREPIKMLFYESNGSFAWKN